MNARRTANRIVYSLGIRHHLPLMSLYSQCCNLNALLLEKPSELVNFGTPFYHKTDAREDTHLIYNKKKTDRLHRRSLCVPTVALPHMMTISFSGISGRHSPDAILSRQMRSMWVRDRTG